MTARQIASHRYGDLEKPVLSTEIELVAEYRKLLVGDEGSGARFGSYVKLLPSLLDCQSARLLYILDGKTRELCRFDLRHSNITLNQGFRDHVGSRNLVVVNDLTNERHEPGFEWLDVSPELVSYISASVVISKLPLCLLVACDDRPRSWTSEQVQRLKDVSQMLVSNLEVTRERQLISIQRRMQRSLVQFVRGNLNAQEGGTEGGGSIIQNRTGSLYSDLDEDLEADDADDETEPYETSRMNVMFDFSARLIRRTLKISGCVLVNIENLTDLANIQADIPMRSTIMGACFLKHLRHREWHDVRMSDGQPTGSTISAESDELQTKTVERQDVFDPCGLAGDWLRQLLECHPRAVSFDEHNIPEALVTLLPAGVKTCLLSPIYDSNAKAFALIVAFDDKPGEFTKADAHYVEAFGSSIYAEVLNQSLQKANEAKALFISKISHEFRTPLHGILASAEFLNDMPETTAAQIGFVQTIDTCGRTLLDIINHVLDYSKLSFSKNVLADNSSTTNVIALEDFDVVETAEQVLTTAFSSYEFKRINEHLDVQKTNSQQSHQSDSDSGRIWEALGRNIEVIVLAKPRTQGYLVHSDMGAFRRIVLNLLGNALKYTHTGHVTLQLELSPATTEGLEDLRISVSDTGIGISSSFLAEMFRPFTQEDEFSAGTGLGLSIVKELCNKLHGNIEVQSRKRKGSTFVVSYPVIPAEAKPSLFPGDGYRRELQNIKFHYHTAEDSEYTENESASDSLATSLLRDSIIKHLVEWYAMQETTLEAAEILLTDDLATTRDSEVLTRFSGPVLTLCSTTAKYEKSMRRRSLPLQMFMAKPCGPNKLGAWVSDCMNKARNIMRMSDGTGDSEVPPEHGRRPSVARRSSFSPPPSMSSTVKPDATSRSNITGGARRTIREEQDEQNLADMYSMQSLSPRDRVDEADKQPANDLWSDSRPLGKNPALRKPSIDTVLNSAKESRTQLVQDVQRRGHMLIVEDNPVNMMLLVAFAKRQNMTVTSAINGEIAVQRVKDRQETFDVILMDINMPVMNGFQAMKAIRKFEQSEGRTTAKIATLTGLSTPEDRARATEMGANAFFTKPVKFAELRQLLVTWGVLSSETAPESPQQ